MAIPEINESFRKREKRLRSVRKPSPQDGLSPIEEGEAYEESDSSRISYNKAVALLWSPEAKVTMPYNSFSEDVDRNLRRIMHHYTTTVVSSSLCAGPKRRFFPASLQDETLFHAMIFSSAMHAAWCQGVPIPQEVYHHRARAICLVNEKLSSQYIEPAAFDNMINTVFFLLITETFDGMPEVLKIHWDGLIQLVQLAGGLECLGLSGITRRSALWADLAAAMIMKKKPRLRPPSPSIQLFDYFGLQSPGTSCLATAFGARMYIFTGSKELSQQASTAFWGLRSISELHSMRKMEAFVDTAEPDDIQYSDRTETLERVLVPLWGVKNEECRCAGLLRMFAWASLIYLYAELRDAPRGMALYWRLADRVREEIDKCRQMDAVYEAFPDLMLWILFLAGQGACDKSKLYFAKTAAEILASQEVLEGLDIKAASQAFLWPIGKANQTVWDLSSKRDSNYPRLDTDRKD